MASDQFCRIADLAIDHCEDVPPLGPEQVAEIVALFVAAGAQAKVSSIHVNGWFGRYDKLSMTERLLEDVFGYDLATAARDFVFVGDSPNDEPMFAAFDNAVGVANIAAFLGQIGSPPRYICTAAGGAGFAELTDCLIAARAGEPRA